MLTADRFYYDALRPRLEALRPAYVYERLCPGNYAVARLSRDLDIPYILEYNGSEAAMRRSFGSGDYVHEGMFLEAEELAFRQATAITCISDHVRDDVVARSENSPRSSSIRTEWIPRRICAAEPSRNGTRSAHRSAFRSTRRSSPSSGRSAAGTVSTC